MIKYIQNAFSNQEHDLIKRYITKINSTDNYVGWDEKFNRYFVHNPKALQKYHILLEDLMSQHFGVKLKKSYCYLAMYGKDGRCHKHVDRVQCQYTFDYCVDFDVAWPLFVEENGETHKFALEKNSALIYRGTENYHWREDRKEGAFCNMIFFHFVPEDFEGALA